MASVKKTVVEKIAESAKMLEVSRAEVLDWQELSQSATTPRVQLKAASAAKRYSDDVVYLEEKIKGSVRKYGAVDNVIALRGFIFNPHLSVNPASLRNLANEIEKAELEAFRNSDTFKNAEKLLADPPETKKAK